MPRTAERSNCHTLIGEDSTECGLGEETREKSDFHSVGKDLYVWKHATGDDRPKTTHSLTDIRENTEWLRRLVSRRYRSVGNDQYTERPHGLRRCTRCQTEKGATLFCHRDFNAARNIFDIYLELASGQGRPPAFCMS